MFVLFKWKYIGGHKNIQIVIVVVSSYFICDVKENGGKIKGSDKKMHVAIARKANDKPPCNTVHRGSLTYLRLIYSKQNLLGACGKMPSIVKCGIFRWTS